MNKQIKIFILLFTIVLLTGCVKYDANMEISKDKSMQLSIIYAVDEDLMQGGMLVDDKQKSNLIDQGFVVTDYADDMYKGIKLEKSVQNIDTISTTEDTKYSLSSMIDTSEEKERKEMFKIERGFFKNKYIAIFEFDQSNSDSNDGIISESQEEMDFELQSALDNLDLGFRVTIPEKPLSNNATTTENDGKTLIWDLGKNLTTDITFEFELYNMTNIYITIGGIILIVMLIILIIIIRIKKSKRPKIVEEGPINTEPLTINNVMTNSQKTSSFIEDAPPAIEKEEPTPLADVNDLTNILPVSVIQDEKVEIKQPTDVEVSNNIPNMDDLIKISLVQSNTQVPTQETQKIPEVSQTPVQQTPVIPEIIPMENTNNDGRN